MLTTFAALFALIFGFTGTASATIEATPASATVQHLEEDEAGWDCATMGNGVCGPDAAVGADAWPAVDNQWAALVQCNYFIEAGESRDACTAAALETFPAIAACAEEDSAGPCYWNATARGNGAGESFTVDAAGTVTFLSAALR